jgi:Mrp family chromosome partitioning ATPase
MLKQVVDDLRMAGINLLGVIIQQRKSSDKHGYRYYRYYSGSVKGQKKAIRSISVQKNVEGSVVKPKNK